MQRICHVHSFSNASSTRSKFLRFSLKTVLVSAPIPFLVFLHSSQNKIGQAGGLLPTSQYAIPKAIWNSATWNASTTSDSLHQANLLYSWPHTKCKNPQDWFYDIFMHFLTGCSWTAISGCKRKWNEPQHTMSAVTKNFKTQRLNRIRWHNATIAILNKHSSPYILQIIIIIIIIIII